MKLTLKYLADHVQDEHDAYVLLEDLRWHGTPICSHCGHDKAYFLKPRNGVARGTGMPKADGKRTQSVRRLWKCAKCRKQFSVLTGTIFHGTKISLRTWLTVMVQMSSAKNGISGREIERMHNLTPETAWYMLHRLREAMKREPMVGLLSGSHRGRRDVDRWQAKEQAPAGQAPFPGWPRPGGVPEGQDGRAVPRQQDHRRGPQPDHSRLS